MMLSTPPALPPALPVTAACIEYAAKQAQISPYIVTSILSQEAGKIGERHYNSNGTYDIGPMQINSIWLKTLAKYGITEDYILYNGCANVYVGTWILRQEINRNPDNIAKAVGSYHSRTPAKRDGYLYQVAKRMALILKGQLPIGKILSHANKTR